MLISIIKKNSEKTWEIARLFAAAKNSGHDVNLVDIKDFRDRLRAYPALGDVSIWRSATASSTVLKAIFLSHFSDKIVLNQHSAQQPYSSYKLYQQNIIEKFTKLRTIPTWHFTAKSQLIATLNGGQLTYPFIQKPNLGGQGFGISVIEDPSATAAIPERVKGYVYQPFIPNNFDYRLMVVGGVMLGAVRRIRPPQKRLNNVSQGATAVAVEDHNTLAELRRICDKIVPLFPLHIMAIDIIESSDDGSLYFLEINTVPQWQGFERATQINVAAKIIALAESLISRRQITKPISDQVSDYYHKNLNGLPARGQLHFLSRMWLWSGSPQARSILDKRADLFISKSGPGLDQQIKTILSIPASHLHRRLKHYQRRRATIAKYPRIKNINHLLELELLARSVYGRDISAAIESQLPTEERLAYHKALLANPADVAVLSSVAVNYLYFSGAKTTLDFWHQIADTRFKPQRFDEASLQIYLITHVIINETKFYRHSLGARQSDFHRLLRIADQGLYQHYHFLPLDIKLEFLVCAKLCGYKTALSSIILGEAEKSLSPIGNYLVDTLNSAARAKSGFIRAEHRSVLYLMSSTAPRPALVA